MKRDRQIPITVLTGFLGAGKTTLLNRILAGRRGRIAVIENELGEVGVDDAFIRNGDEQLIEMNNGCICCTVRGDLIRILGALLERSPDLDRIVIETTGLADPAPVLQAFLTDERLHRRLALDALVTVVDARHAARHLASGPGPVAAPASAEHRRQVAFADVLLLNKIDLVGADELRRVDALLRRSNRSARLHHTWRAQIDLGYVLDLGAFDLERALAVEPTLLEERPRVHDPTVATIGLEVEPELDARKLVSWLHWLVRERGDDLLRIKGVLALRGQSRQVVLQGVHRLIETQEGRPWGATPRSSRLVLIGRNLDRAELRAGLQACA